MSTEVKSGKEVLDEFFTEIQENKKLDESVVKKIVELHGGEKLTDTNLTNGLTDLREIMISGQNKEV